MAASADNLIWIDLEMTDLDPDRDRIIEIATVVTDPSLNVVAEGPVIAVVGAPFNNLFGADLAMPRVDFAAHAASLGAQAEKVETLAALPAALDRARRAWRENGGGGAA